MSGSGFTSDRFGYRQTVTASFAGTATGVLLLLAMSYAPSMSLLVAFVLVFGLCMGVRGPIVSSIATRRFAGPRVATIYGTIYATNAVALAAAPFWAVRVLRDFR